MKKQLNHSLCTLLLLSTTLSACSTPNTEMKVDNKTTVQVEPTPEPLSPEETNLLKLQVRGVMDKAFNDEDFKSRLTANPNDILTEEGLVLAEGSKLKVLDYSQGQIFMILDDRNLETFYPEIKTPNDKELNDTQKLFQKIRLKAQSDAQFKAKLLLESSATLIAEGMNPKVAETFTVLDYESATDFFLVLPPNQEPNRMVYELVIRPFIQITKQFVQQSIETLVGEALNAVVRDNTEAAFQAVEATCYFPRIFGAHCGVSRSHIEQFIRSEI